jgi:hypothetical protein
MVHMVTSGLKQGSSTPRPNDWFSAARPDDYFFRSLAAIFAIVKTIDPRQG